MNRFYKYNVLSLIMIFFVASSASGDSPPPPWSEIVTSNNGAYNLVLISPKVKELERYVAQTREFWRKGGIDPEGVPEAEAALQEEIDAEEAIRKKYAESGLYTAEKSPKLLWRFDVCDMRNSVKVSNDGEHIVVSTDTISGILKEKPIENNPEISEVISVKPNLEEIVLTFYSSGKLIRSYKARELVSTEESMRRTAANNFHWSDQGVLEENERNFVLTNKNNEKLVFDITTGNLISGKLANNKDSLNSEINDIQTSKYDNNKSFCGGIALLLGLVLFVLRR